MNVTKKTALLPLLVVLLLWFDASPAHATPVTDTSFTLIVTDATTGLNACTANCTATITDTFVKNSITAFGNVGSFQYDLTTASITAGDFQACPTPGLVCMDLAPWAVTNLGNAGGEFEATLLVTGLTEASLGITGNNVQALTSTGFLPDRSDCDIYGNNCTGPANESATVTTTVAGTNIDPLPVPGTTQQNVTLNLLPDGTFQMQQTFDINFLAGNGIQASGDSSVALINAPEPGTMMLFGSGLGVFGLASFGRRRSKKDAV